ncbi:MAG: T9SS type A sorting domain-containing protein [Bacteroidia bacterium]
MKKALLLALFLAGSMAYAQVVWTMAGTPNTSGNTGDGGLATAATFTGPNGVATDGSGNTYIVDGANHRVRKVSSTGVITAFAGTGTSGFSGDGGQATLAKLNNPVGVAVDGSGNVFICDALNYRIRKVNTSGVISTVAGTGTSGFSGDGGLATSAQLNRPDHLTYDAATGDLYFSDGLVKVRKFIPGGNMNLVAGTGTAGYSGNNGAATSANMSGVEGIAIDATYIYVVESANIIVRKIQISNGVITAFAGTQGSSGHTGNGGQASSATFNTPREIRIDGSGNFFIADQGNQVIRKINTSGVISDYTSPGTYSGEGVVPGSASIDLPYGLFINSSGDMFITDQGSYSVRKISANCPALAGPNKIDQNTNCCGCTTTGVVIGTPTVTNMTYSWSPSGAGNISGSNTIAQPTATWCNTATTKTYTVTVSNANCTTATSTLTVTTNPYQGANCCRIGHFPAEEGTPLSANFSVFPNPATTQITISLYNSSDNMKIMDITGKIIYEAKDLPAGELTVDVSRYMKGVYIVAARIGGTTEKQRIVIE